MLSTRQTLTYFFVGFAIAILISFISRASKPIAMREETGAPPSLPSPEILVALEPENSSVARRETAEREPSSMKTSLQSRLKDFLNRDFGVNDWLIESDASGRPFRIAGGTLGGIMSVGEKHRAFLERLQDSLGFRLKASFARAERKTARLRIIDEEQWLEANGELFRVFSGGIRMIGNTEGDDAFLVQNDLRSVDPTIRFDIELAPEDALSIAQSELHGSVKRDQDFQYSIMDPGVVIFADEPPHQKATLVLAKNGADQRLMLIGHQSRSVVKTFPLTKK